MVPQRLRTGIRGLGLVEEGGNWDVAGAGIIFTDGVVIAV